MTTETQAQQEVKNAEFAFVVLKQKDGRFAIVNINNEGTERQPSLEEVYVALTSLQRDIDRQALAMTVINAMNQTQQSQQASSGLVLPEKKFVKRS